MFRRLLVMNQTIGPLFNGIIREAEEYYLVKIFKGIKYSRGNTTLRLATWILFTLQASAYIVVRGKKYDHVLIVSNPPLLPIIATLTSRPYSLLLYDLYPHVLEQVSQDNPWLGLPLRVITGCWHCVNRLLVRNAHRVYVLTESMAESIRWYFRTDLGYREKVIVVPPWADIERQDTSEDEVKEFRDRYCSGGLLIVYAGNIGMTHSVEHLIEATSRLESSVGKQRFKVLFFGEGQKKRSVVELSKCLKINNRYLQFEKLVPYNQVKTMLASADIGVVAIDGTAASFCLPSKVFNILSAGTAVLAIAPRNSELSRLVRYYKCGFVVDPDEYASVRIEEIVKQLLEEPVLLKEASRNALIASKEFTEDNAKKLIETLLTADG